MKTRMVKRMLLILLAVIPTMRAAAQDWKDVLKGVATAVEEKAGEKLSEKMDTLLIIGSWQYAKPDVSLKSVKGDLLTQAGSDLAAKKAEDHLVQIFNKLGINEHTVFTFNADSTYSMRTDKRTMQGTYSVNKKTREIIMTSRLKLRFAAVVEQNILKPKSLYLRFKADKLMDLAKHISGALVQKSTSKSIALVNNLLSKYDDLTIGYELKKQ